MTKSAAEFVTPLTFQALTHRPVEVEMFAMQDERAAGHVAMGRQAEVVVVAPATAHVIARLAHGFSDDLVATTVLATSAPVIVAPAMETHMWRNPATVENVARPRRRAHVPDRERRRPQGRGPRAASSRRRGRHGCGRRGLPADRNVHEEAEEEGPRERDDSADDREPRRPDRDHGRAAPGNDRDRF